jgi:hypothetical protein
MNTLTRLNGLQKTYISTILELISDYKEWDDLGGESVIALRVMCMGKDDENLPYLVNQYITKILKDRGANNE